MSDEKAQYVRDRALWAEKKLAWVAHEQRLRDQIASLRDALTDYAHAYHREVHPGCLAFELRVSPQIHGRALRVLRESAPTTSPAAHPLPGGST